MLPHAGNMSAANSPALLPHAQRLGADLELHMKVVPGASRTALANELGDRLKDHVAEPPKDGKNNRAVVH